MYESIRFARADLDFSRNTPDSLRRSVALAPGNAAAHLLLAEHLESTGSNPDPELQRAADLDPMESLPWIRLAFQAESAGNMQAAEKYLLRASAVDRKSDPKWALMNFYFRRENRPAFWLWATRSMETGYGDLSEIFKLSWRASDDPAEILGHIPPKAEILRKYVIYLLEARRDRALPPAAARLATVAPTEDARLLLETFDRSIAVDPDSALAMWNSMCTRRLIPFVPLDPSAGRIVTNKGFEPGPPVQGFDWRVQPVDQIDVSQAADAAGFTVQFSGRQPDDAVVLTQLMPTVAGRRYRLDYEYSSPDAARFAGLVFEAAGASSPPMDVTADWKPGAFEFTAAGPVTTLQLRYRRPVGTLRAQGTAAIRRITDTILP